RGLMEGAKAADGVQYDRDADAGAGAVRQRANELFANLPALEDVALHVDRFARAADCVEHHRIERRAICEYLDFVSVLKGRVAGGFEHVYEVFARRIDLPLDVIRNRRREERDQDQPGDERAADDRQVEHVRAVPAWMARAAQPGTARTALPLES